MKQAIKLARCVVAFVEDAMGRRVGVFNTEQVFSSLTFAKDPVIVATDKDELRRVIRALESLRDELPDGPKPKWEPKIGDVVIARHDPTLDREYVAEAQRERSAFGADRGVVAGIVARSSDAHEICLTLRREDGHEAVFNLSELSPIGAAS